MSEIPSPRPPFWGRFPGWFWWVIGFVIVLGVCALCKFTFTIGAGGLHVTQGIIH